MPCNPLTDPTCVAGSLIKSATSSAAGDVLSGIAAAVTAGVKWIVTGTATWWLRLPSPDLSGESAVTAIQHWLLPVTTAVAVAGIIAAGARMALTRRASPLLDVTGGLLTLAAAGTLGVAAATLLLKAGDAWSAWVLQASTGGQFTSRLTAALTLGNGAAPAAVLVFGVIAIVLSLVQAALMLFRQVALIVLAGVLPLAAAGSVAPLTRAWVRTVSTWMLALICYKPAAAAVYAAAFTMIGAGSSPSTMVMGFVMLLLSVLTLPALMKFFTWTTGSIAGPGGGGQLLGAATMGAIAVGAMRGYGGTSAQDQAAYLESRLGPPPGGSAGPSSGGPSSGGPPSGPAGPGPAPSGGAPSGPAAAGRPAPWPQPGQADTPTPAGVPFPPSAGPAASGAAPASVIPPSSTTPPPGAAAATAAVTGATGAVTAATHLVADTTHLAAGAMTEGEDHRDR
jgi:hypothetical protein